MVRCLLASAGARRADGMIWTPAVIAEMYALLDEGLSQAAIGERMGCSKNTIAGKLRGLGVRSPPQPKFKAEPKPKAVPKPVVAAPPPPEPFVPRACQFPIGEPRTKAFRYCGEPLSDRGGVYCTEHRRLCYQAHRELTA